jgi:hypothetical protein
MLVLFQKDHKLLRPINEDKCILLLYRIFIFRFRLDFSYFSELFLPFDNFP